MNIRYEKANEYDWKFCRVATYVLIRDGCEHPELNPPEPCCDPSLGGIMIPCKCSDHFIKLPIGTGGVKCVT